MLVISAWAPSRAQLLERGEGLRATSCGGTPGRGGRLKDGRGARKRVRAAVSIPPNRPQT